MSHTVSSFCFFSEASCTSCCYIKKIERKIFCIQEEVVSCYKTSFCSIITIRKHKHLYTNIIYWKHTERYTQDDEKLLP